MCALNLWRSRLALPCNHGAYNQLIIPFSLSTRKEACCGTFCWHDERRKKNTHTTNGKARLTAKSPRPVLHRTPATYVANTCRHVCGDYEGCNQPNRPQAIQRARKLPVARPCRAVRGATPKPMPLSRAAKPRLRPHRKGSRQRNDQRVWTHTSSLTLRVVRPMRSRRFGK